MQPSNAQVEAFQAKYREISERCNWGHSWPSDEAASELLTAALSVEQEPIGYVTGSNMRAMTDGLQGVMTVSHEQNALFQNPIYAHPPIPVSSPARDQEIERLKGDARVLGYANVYRDEDGTIELGSADIDVLSDVTPWASTWQEHVGIAEIRLLPNTNGKTGAEVLTSPSVSREDGNRALPYERDTLGRFVREAWVRWAETQPNPKPSWLAPYDDLSEADKEADRQIGEAVARWTLIGDAASLSDRSVSGDAVRVNIKPLEWKRGTPESVYGQNSFTARPTAGGEYVIRRMYSTSSWTFRDTVFDTADQAKAAAKVDYESRIRSALVTADRTEEENTREVHVPYLIPEPEGGWRNLESFTDEERDKLRPIAETLAMLDGNAFFGMDTSIGGDIHEQYLAEADALYQANGGDNGWAGESSIARAAGRTEAGRDGNDA